MAKRLSEKQKEEIIKLFISGKTLDELSNEFKCSKFTITRNLKINIGEKKYKELIKINKTITELSNNDDQYMNSVSENNSNNKYYEDNFIYEKPPSLNAESEYFPETPFMEIIPLDYKIGNSPQKDLASIPISDVDFPKIVYMIVDKNIELEIKNLKDYPEWNFLSIDELNRKTIEIYDDLKIAKRFCNKEQKVIKVPNTHVFKIVAPILISKGISRIVSSDKLIAL